MKNAPAIWIAATTPREWRNDAIGDLAKLKALDAAIAAGDPGPALAAKEKRACDAQFPTAAKSHGAIGQNKKWRSCYSNADSDGAAATAAYNNQVAALGINTGTPPPASTSTTLPPCTDPTNPACQGNTVSPTASDITGSPTPASNNNALYAIGAIGLLLLIGFLFYKPTPTPPPVA